MSRLSYLSYVHVISQDFRFLVEEKLRQGRRKTRALVRLRPVTAIEILEICDKGRNKRNQGFTHTRLLCLGSETVAGPSVIVAKFTVDERHQSEVVIVNLLGHG